MSPGMFEDWNNSHCVVLVGRKASWLCAINTMIYQSSYVPSVSWTDDQWLLFFVDFTLDMSAVSVARTVTPGNSKPSNGNEDVRQPSVDGLHSPSSPSAPVSLPKHGMWTSLFDLNFLLFLTLTSSSFFLFPRPTLLLLILLFFLSSSFSSFPPPSLLLPLICLLSCPPLPLFLLLSLIASFSPSFFPPSSLLPPFYHFNHPPPLPSLSSPLPLPSSSSEPKPSIISKRKTPAKSGVSLGVKWQFACNVDSSAILNFTQEERGPHSPSFITACTNRGRVCTWESVIMLSLLVLQLHTKKLAQCYQIPSSCLFWDENNFLWSWFTCK